MILCDTRFIKRKAANAYTVNTRQARPIILWKITLFTHFFCAGYARTCMHACIGGIVKPLTASIAGVSKPWLVSLRIHEITANQFTHVNV